MKKLVLLAIFVILCLFSFSVFGTGCGLNPSTTTEQAQSDNSDTTETNPAGDVSTPASENETHTEESLPTLKATATTNLNDSITALLEKITDDDLRTEITAFREQKLNDISALTQLENAKPVLAQIAAETSVLIQNMLLLQLSELKTTAVAELDEMVAAGLDKLQNEELKTQLAAFYITEKSKIIAVSELNNISATVLEVKNNVSDYIVQIIAQQLLALKNSAIANLDEIVNTALDKLIDDTLKTQLNSFYTEEKAVINAITKAEDLPAATAQITTDLQTLITTLITQQYAALKSAVSDYFSAVVASFHSSPYDFIPEAMIPGYTANLITESEVSYEFSNFVNINDIKYGGFGKQWNMVIDNIHQSEYFYKFLNTGASVLTSAIDTVNGYLVSVDFDTANKSFAKENFNAAISFENNVFTFTVEYQTSITAGFLGNISPMLSMIYNAVSGEKTYIVQATDTNRLRYTVSDNKYEVGIEYGISEGQRTSYLIIERKDSVVEGHIYEYITVKGKDVVPSCADFYMENGYVSVVGNKADAMMGTKGYINELYKANEGKLLGYEVRETISSVDYNTLWFNLCDISGITSIKIGEKTSQGSSDKRTIDVYLNNNATNLFIPTYNKKFGITTSRKYDIEFRTQYFYSIDTNTGEIIEHEIKVPMMFIQEDNDKDTNYSDYQSNILADNGINSQVTLNPTVLNKIMTDYDRLIDDFIENKQMMSSAEIKAYIEQ